MYSGSVVPMRDPASEEIYLKSIFAVPSSPILPRYKIYRHCNPASGKIDDVDFETAITYSRLPKKRIGRDIRTNFWTRMLPGSSDISSKWARV
ncbi:hypothetical protein GYMLUDRAFT_835909 [Collybiopsis luxurians FD-317 M1]|uniref:Unplaced genomic scaffold GYMLUscaffold_57, whole genome shotgun sequence n=1 Tax=Collybiopsis luxurians FD-317 M1 TaxID=944289 RepID=A0A0D0CBR5_9AGAR|nr:hypothetical protein GYMLUDRAFT_835909 [Collybiopsis luxurians FD-317 M1]